ncbi:MAG TPA: C45 family peptidase [Gemmataceae bacterium]|nr:C45 family peptidase [Gemmataceae bacterium]
MCRRFVISLAFVLVSVGSLRADPPFRFPEGKCTHGELKYINGIPVLTVDGTPGEIGTAVGLLALQPGKRMARYPEDILDHFYLSTLRLPLVHAGRQMVKEFPPAYRDELEAMVHAAHVDRDLGVLGNTMFDLKKVLACSAILVEPARSATTGTLMGRNLDYPPLGYAQDYSLVTIYRPLGVKHAFATIGFPGLIGCLSGMNDAGLAVAVLEVVQVKSSEKRFDAHGLPYALCYRKILEECSTIAEAYETLSRLKRTGLSNLVVADQNDVAVFEITPERIVVRRGPNGACVCTNHFCSEDLKPSVTLNLFNTFDRFGALAKVSELDRKLGPSDLHVGLHQANHQGYTMQTMIFECATARLHLAIGAVPSSAGEMKVIELGPLFRGQ